jgi:cell wall-associated NlpC family hydrolase
MIRKRLVSVALATGIAAAGFAPFAGPTPAAEAAGFRIMHVGDRGASVVWVQQQLHVRTTGYYGNETRVAVVKFQRWFHIGTSGAVGPATMARLQQVARINAARHAPRRPAPSLASRAIQVAASQRGKPYVFGATGPRAFDCSGFTRYVFGRLGKSLPHNASAQRSATQPVSRSNIRIGDLVFLDGGGHVGIYAGNGSMWDAPHSGSHVQLRRIYSSSYSVGRISAA